MGPCKTCKGHGSIERHWVCGIAPDWSDRHWRPGRWTRHQCYNGWTASGKGVLSWRQPMLPPRTSSTGRRWWMHGKFRVRPIPRSAPRPAWFQRGDRRQGEFIRATFDDLPSSGALFDRATCRCWRKRSSSPCLPRARKRRSQRMYILPQGGGYLGVDPPITVGQAMESFQGGSGFPGTTTARGAKPPPAYGRVVH